MNPEPWPRRLDVKARRRLDARLDTSMQRLDASTSPVGVTTLRRIKLDTNGSLDAASTARRSLDGSMLPPTPNFCDNNSSNTLLRLAIILALRWPLIGPCHDTPPVTQRPTLFPSAVGRCRTLSDAVGRCRTVGRARAISIFADSDLTIRTRGTLLMKMVGDFVSSKLHTVVSHNDTKRPA